MSLLDWFLTLITLAASFAVIQFCFKRRDLKFATLGMIVGACSVLYCASPLLSWYKIKNLKYKDLNASETLVAEGVPLAHGLPTRWTGEALRFDLSLGGRQLQTAVDDAGQMNRLLILDAARGIAPEYQAWTEKEFGKLTPNPQEKQTVCFRRVPEVPYATGICREQNSRFAFTPSPGSYAVSSDGKSAFVQVKHNGSSHFAITTLTLDNGPEELCLAQLSKGSACAGIEVLPDGALSVLFLEASDTTQKHVMDEFHVPTIQTADLSIQTSENPYRCGGFDEKNGFLTVRPANLKEKLAKVANESTLTETIRELDKNLTCPGPVSLEIPVFAIRNVESAMRSFLTQILEKPFWLTPPASYLGRKKKIETLTLGQDGYSLRLTSPQEIKKLAITVVSPVTFDEEILHFMKPAADADLKIYRSGTTAFRMVTTLLPNTEFAIDTSPVLRGTSAINASVVSDWTGFNRSMLFALALALIINWLQGFATVRTEKQVFFPMTFFYIAFIGLLWSFLSYRASFQGSQGTAELTEERPSDPQYVTLRDWNEDWWKKVVEAKEEHVYTTQVVSASWKSEVDAGRKKAHEEIPTTEGMKYLDLNPKVDPQFLTQAEVLIWDAPEVRNWYFRKSPAYASALTAWQSLIRMPGVKGEVSAASPLDFSKLNKNTMVVVLDESKLSESNQKALNDWISAGGTAIYHSALDPALSPVPDSYQKKSYSKIPDSFGSLIEINRTHYLQTKTGKWYAIKNVGSGRSVFAGVVPYQGTSQQLLKELLQGLQKSEVVTNSFHADGCHTAILAEPYGASPEALRGFANRLKASGISLQWALSAESFARMAPEWKSSFTAANVVFLDDGKAETREFAVELYQRFFKVSSKPVFVTVQAEKPNMLGPEALLLRADLIPSGETKENSAALWESSCLTGVSRPRLLASSETKNALGFWQESLLSLRSFHFQNAAELLENAALLANPQKRKWKSSSTDPMKYDAERNSP